MQNAHYKDYNRSNLNAQITNYPHQSDVQLHDAQMTDDMLTQANKCSLITFNQRRTRKFREGGHMPNKLRGHYSFSNKKNVRF